MSKVPFPVAKYSYLAKDAPLREVLAAFSAAENLSIIVDAGVDQEWRIAGEFKEVPATEFLARVCALGNLLWYYDKSALYLYRASQVDTVLMDLMHIHAGDVRRMLRELGVEDPRFPISTTHNDELLLISGPPRYVALIKELVGKADRLQQQRSVRDETVMIFRLKHAWADDVTLGTGNKAQTVKGVATLLRELLASTHSASAAVGGAEKKGAPKSEVAEAPKNTAYAKLAPRTVPGAEGEEEKEETLERRPSEVSIMADNRTNSVIVRDAKAMMPRYEELIAQLDVPVRLVEIAVTVLDIDQGAMLDWELRLKGLYDGKHIQAGAGIDAQNAFLPSAVTGLGLSAATVFTTSNLNLLNSITALQQKSKARTISRPSLLTLDNISATLSDTHSYRSKVVGKEVVELAEVTAGMRLTVQPRIVDLAVSSMPPLEGENPPPRYEIWMILSIEDGGFESITVDDMPMTRSSTLDTQAGVREGESLLVGGYMHEVQSETKWGIPWLRDIPWIGWLFGGTGVEKSMAQRMFLLTPRVITLDVSALPEKQAVNLRSTAVERRVQGAVNEENRQGRYLDETAEKAERETDKRWREYLKRTERDAGGDPPPRAVTPRTPCSGGGYSPAVVWAGASGRGTRSQMRAGPEKVSVSSPGRRGSSRSSIRSFLRKGRGREGPCQAARARGLTPSVSSSGRSMGRSSWRAAQ